MSALRSIAAAFGMFSILPIPRVEWNKNSLRWVLCAFPLVGTAVGLLCWGWTELCACLDLPTILCGAGLTLIPVLSTGGIHLDGYADTWDALASCASPEKKREILADPHLGAFAVIHLCGWFIADFALWTALLRYEAVLVILSFTLSRSLSGLAVATFPLAKNTGLAHTFAKASDRKHTRRFLTGLSILLCIGLCFQGWQGAAIVAAALSVFLYYRRMSQKQFGGLSGDLAGWFLQTAELWMLGAMVLVQYVEELLCFLSLVPCLRESGSTYEMPLACPGMSWPHRRYGRWNVWRHRLLIWRL